MTLLIVLSALARAGSLQQLCLYQFLYVDKLFLVLTVSALLQIAFHQALFSRSFLSDFPPFLFFFFPSGSFVLNKVEKLVLREYMRTGWGRKLRNERGWEEVAISSSVGLGRRTKDNDTGRGKRPVRAAKTLWMQSVFKKAQHHSGRKEEIKLHKG